MDKYFETAYAKALLLAMAIFLMCSTGLIMDYAWRISSCDTSFLLFCSEVLKLLYSIRSYLKEMKEKGLKSELGAALTVQFWYEARYFGVPAGLYFIVNNAALLVLQHISAHLLSMLANINLLITAVLAMIYLKQKISKTQWFSLMMIVVGMMTTVRNPGHKKGNAQSASMLFTLSFGISTSIISATAGTICEKLYKSDVGNPALDNVHIQNVKMYAFGIFFNVLSIGFFGLKNMSGFNYLHLILIVLQSIQGLMMGFIMKYLNNVVRGIAVAVGSVVSTIASVLFLGNELTGHFVVGGFITLVSAHMYRSFPVPKPDSTDVKREDDAASASLLPYKHIIILVPLLLMMISGQIETLDKWIHGKTNSVVLEKHPVF